MGEGFSWRAPFWLGTVCHKPPSRQVNSEFCGIAYNAFVAYTSAWPQTAEHQAANRRAVTEELLVGKAGQPYFQLLRRELAAARALARQAGCEDFFRYIAWLRGETLSYNKGMARAAHDRLHRAIEGLFAAAETHAGV
jgi:hypothetical protein